MHRLILLSSLVASAAAVASEDAIPFFPREAQTCLGTGPIRGGGEAREVTLIRQKEPDPISEDAAFVRLRASRGLPTDARFQSVWATVRQRDGGEPLLAQLGCLPDGPDGLSCSVDCDGGTIRVSSEAGRFSFRSEGLRMTGTCGGTRQTWWRGTPRGAGMPAERLAGPACDAAVSAMRPGFASQGHAVFDRFASGKRCFARTYDAAHLRAHQTQTVTAARIAYAGLDAEDSGRVRVKVALTFRDGHAATEELACQPEGFGVQCYPGRGDGEALVTRAGNGSLRVSTRGADGTLETLGGTPLAKGDDVFLLHDAECETGPEDIR